MAAVGATGAATSPNLRSKILALFLGCLVDDLPAGVMCASGVLKGGLGVLGEGVGSGVVLTGAPALPSRAIASPSRVLQLLQNHLKFSGEPFDSSPSMWSITRNRVEPHKAHLAGPGGRHSGWCALYRFARSVIVKLGFLRALRRTPAALLLFPLFFFLFVT